MTAPLATHAIFRDPNAAHYLTARGAPATVPLLFDAFNQLLIGFGWHRHQGHATRQGARSSRTLPCPSRPMMR